MTLAFSQEINGKRTLFPEKILSSLRHLEIDEFSVGFITSEFYSGEDIIAQKPKIHTIREDKSNRWKAGNNIHFVINNRRKTRLQFASVIPCVSTQEIRICGLFGSRGITVDDRQLSEAEVHELILNDGFDSVDRFWDWVTDQRDIEGKIIHWTEKRY